METYGLTENGVNPKRYDIILDELHDSLSAKLGVSTRQNPESLLGHLLANIADELAELWEYATDVYHSQYPSSAEGVSLDNALQAAGITREMPRSSYYYILCTGIDGTAVPEGTRIASDTSPSVPLLLADTSVISRDNFNTAVITVAGDSGIELSAIINGKPYKGTTLDALCAQINGDEFTAVMKDGKLCISAVDTTSSNTLILCSDLTTESVGSVFLFGTEDYGDIVIPQGKINQIVKSVPGLASVFDVGANRDGQREYISGRLIETDSEFRMSHLDKIFIHSSRMTESIRSAILENVMGVSSVVVFENDTNETDSYGRPPHSIEVVVEGGDKKEIAEQILSTKAAGISTYRTADDNGVTVQLKGDYGENIEVRFNRPHNVYIYFKIVCTQSRVINMPTNYVEMVQDAIRECVGKLNAGENVVPQSFINTLRERVAGIDYFDIQMHSSDSPSENPTEYNERIVEISPRARAVTSADKIGVIPDG